MIVGAVIYRKPMWNYMKKAFGCTKKKHNRTATSINKPVSGRNVITAFHEWYPSYSEQNAVLAHPVHFFYVLIFHFRQIIIWRMYGIIAVVFYHSLDHLDTGKPFAFSHTSQCLLPPIRSAILQDGVTRCYPIRFPTVLLVQTIISVTRNGSLWILNQYTGTYFTNTY